MTLVWRGDDAAVLLVAPAVPGPEQRGLSLRELAGHLQRRGWSGLSDEALAVRHHCPGCGSTAHGAPSLDWNRPVSVPPTPALPQVSFSRSQGWLALAWSDHRRLGIDIDDAHHPAFADGGLGEAIYTGEEQQRHGQAQESQRRWARAEDWVAKEALAKAHGVGFGTQDPQAFTTTDLRRGHLVPSADWELPDEARQLGLIGAVVLLDDSAQREGGQVLPEQPGDEHLTR